MNKAEFDKIHERLSVRQRQVLQRVLVNESDSTIGNALGIKETSVRKHIERMAHSFGLKNAPGERRSRRSSLLTLFARYKPEAIAENPLFKNTEGEISNLSERVDKLEKKVSDSLEAEGDNVSTSKKQQNQENALGNQKRWNNLSLHWGNNPDITSFSGRDQELTDLKRWILEEDTRLIGISGVSGIGKTYLANKLFQDVERENNNRFKEFLWLTINEPLNLTNLLDNLINRFRDKMSNSAVSELLLDYDKFPQDINGKILLLLEFLEEYQLMLVLDGIDFLLEKGKLVGEYQEKYSDYGEFIKRWGKQQHKSCLIITTKDKLKEIASLEVEKGMAVKSLELAGISAEDAKEIFKAKACKMANNSTEDWKNLIEAYGGNPLALKMAIDFIQELCNGSISDFLELKTLVFGDIESLVKKVYEGLSETEKYMIQFLAKSETYLSIKNLVNDLLEKKEENPLTSKSEVMNTMLSLKRRGLIQTSDKQKEFKLQRIIEEFINEEIS